MKSISELQLNLPRQFNFRFEISFSSRFSFSFASLSTTRITLPNVSTNKTPKRTKMIEPAEPRQSRISISTKAKLAFYQSSCTALSAGQLPGDMYSRLMLSINGVCYCPSAEFLRVWPHCTNATWNRCQEDLNSFRLGDLEETSRTPSYCVDEDYPAGRTMFCTNSYCPYQ